MAPGTPQKVLKYSEQKEVESFGLSPLMHILLVHSHRLLA